MRDRPFIIAGLAAFLVLATLPVWYNVAARAHAATPVLAIPSDASIERVRARSGTSRDGTSGLSFGPSDRRTSGRCIASREFMRGSHMQMLAAWRDEVVRDGHRVFVADDGHRYEKNLAATCLGCHENKAQFCDRCHDYVAVAPDCMDCHKT